jgi:hypothetical protein
MATKPKPNPFIKAQEKFKTQKTLNAMAETQKTFERGVASVKKAGGSKQVRKKLTKAK